MNADDVARTIDHSLLKAEATADQIDALCDEACTYGFKAVCVNPVHVRQAADRLSAHRHGPHDSPAPAVKADEARRAIDEGATEIDMVANLGALIDGDLSTVQKDIETVARVVHQTCRSAILKVILETRILSGEQIIVACRCCRDGGADFVKTSTGFHPAGGATVEHVRLLHRHASPMLVKAAGGIRTAEQALAMLEAGAARLGTSSGVAIVNGLRHTVS